MSDRFSDLSPITFAEYETIGYLAFSFFNPLNNRNMRKVIGKTNEGSNLPLAANEFYQYLHRHVNKDYERKIHKVKKVLNLMERAGIITNEGHSVNAMLGERYYSLKELTNIQLKNTLWLGEAFGLSYLSNKLRNNVVHITGVNSKGDVCNGTGFLINPKTILTCKHVVIDMEPDIYVSIMGNEYSYSIKFSSDYDIALLLLNEKINSINCFPAFNKADLLDEVLIMGYPPITGTNNAHMLIQKGEINAIVYDYLSKTNNLVLSSVTRPGNSGGPVISKNGYIVGMVMQRNVSGLSVSAVAHQITMDDPFYMAVHGDQLFNEIKRIDPDIEIDFEDYK